jgi:multiple sugar transport system permease protein
MTVQSHVPPALRTAPRKESRVMRFSAVARRRIVWNAAVATAAAVLIIWTVLPFAWILLTSLKSPTDIISVPPKFIFKPTIGNYAALALGNHAGEYSSSRPDFPLFFLNSVVISIGAVALSVVASIPAAYALARFTFPLKNALGFVFMSFRFVPFLAFVIPLYLIYQQVGLYNTHIGLILCYQLITLPFTIWMLRSFFMEIPLEIQEAAQIDGCSWLGILTRVILPLSMPGIAVTVILGFMFCWNAFNYPLMLAGRETFPVTVGAIQFISYDQVLWGQMAAATIVSAMPQLLLSLMVQKYIVRGLTMGAVR